MSLIKKILDHREFVDKPPILIDIGASGELHKDWKDLAPYSICLAFDADSRDFNVSEIENKDFRKLYIYNCVVVDENISYVQENFFLTKFPHCSSILEPLEEKLSHWVYADLFQVEKKIKLNVRNLPEILKERNITYIDWFKSDSQGTDLRLIKSISNIIPKMIITEFEPGILDAYKGEDKFFHILEFMEKYSFWMDELNVLGTQRIHINTVKKFFPFIEYNNAKKYIKTSPGWVKVSYINTFEGSNYSKRDLLLGIAVSIVKNQYGYALDLTLKAMEIYPEEELFSEILNSLIKHIKSKRSKYFLHRVKNKLKRTFGF
jgi:hypothetical protein